MFGTAHLHRVGSRRVTLKKRQAPSRRTVLLFLAIGVTTLSAFQSLALFTSSPNGTESLRAGTVILTLGSTPTTLAVTGMAPGDSTSQTFQVANTGSLDLRYAITSSTSSGDGRPTNLANALTANLYDASTCTGTVLYTGTFAALQRGDPATGWQTGDRDLSSGMTDWYCLKLDLTTGVGNTYQDASTATTITFNAEQKKNTLPQQP